MTTQTAQAPPTTRREGPPRGRPPQRQTRPQNQSRRPQTVAFGAIEPQGHRVGIYGPGGIGKTTFAANAPGPVAFFDLDDSLPVLRPALAGCDVRRVQASESWEAIRYALHADGWDEIRTIVIDSATKAEELALAWTLANVPHEKDGVVIRRIEDYGFGKGYQHLYETFLHLLGDLDRHVRAGRNVVLVCHDCTATVPNPAGEDWLRYEPRLQNPNSGKASVRLRVREWLDHLLYVGYDVACEKGDGGKATGSGTRTVYPRELPFCMAKSRTLAEPVELLPGDTTLWDRLRTPEGGAADAS